MYFIVVTGFVAVLFGGLLALGLRRRAWKFAALNFTGMALNIAVVVLEVHGDLEVVRLMAALLALVGIFTAEIVLLSRQTRRLVPLQPLRHKTAESIPPRLHPEYTLMASKKRFLKELLHHPGLSEKNRQQMLQFWQQGNAAFERRDLPEAQKQYELSLQVAPTPSALNNLAIVFLVSNHAEAALQRCEQACQLDPEHLDAWLNRGRVLLALKRFVEALASFDQAVALQPNMLAPWIFRAHAFVQMGQFESAIQSYDAALGLNSNRAECWNNRGVALSKTGKWPEAVTSFERALKIQPDYYPASLNRALAIDKLGQLDQAKLYYRNFLQQPPPAINGNLALVRSRLQQLESGAPARFDFNQLELELAS
jgi:tetratricopeptide (TPR) repeat protein